MSDPTAHEAPTLLPPPPPPLPPGRLGQLQRIIAPWGKHTGSSKTLGSPAQVDQDHIPRRTIGGIPPHSALPPQTAVYQTGIPIAAVDVNEAATHAVLAGRDILKTVRVQEGKVSEEFDLRSAIDTLASRHSSPRLDGSNKRREYLPARDVRWSRRHYDHIVATAASNGRIALYDLKALGPRIEFAWLHEHTGQINKLEFDPFAGHYLLSASQDKSVRLWDIREQPEKSRLRFDVRSAARDVRWSPSETSETLDFAVCVDGGGIQKWDARVPRAPLLSISAHERACYSLDWHPDGKHVISGGFDRYIKVWDFSSDNKRQKPVFQLKVPHAINNIRWRPACWSAETAETGYWQSTQVAVSYYREDPRTHIWDLRRPHLPFRELDHFKNPPNDFLWASKDLLWSVGEEGIFSQWDIRQVSALHNQIPPCTSTFVPDGQIYSFSEDRTLSRGSSFEDSALGFLNISQEKLSGGDDVTASRSFTDDEAPVPMDRQLSTSYRHSERFSSSARSTKSQANSPPSTDYQPPMLPLDRAIFDRRDLLSNNQIGAAAAIQGIASDLEIAEYLSAHYASPATLKERMKFPDRILQRLEAAFIQNAQACDQVAMHRMAQSWRILAAVIVPELKDWADSNRAKRQADAAKRRETLEKFRSSGQRPGLSPLAGLPHRGLNTKEDGRPHNLMSSLFRGIVESERSHHAGDHESTSNMTTPLVKPLPSSPPADKKAWSQTSSDEHIDDIAPLPPSVLTSHSTAAAAARALLDSPERETKPMSTSPDGVRPTSSSSQIAIGSAVRPSANRKTEGFGSLGARKGATKTHDQEDRRAALRDYRVQARPIFTLNESAALEPETRHDSGESFPMFSASTDSSHKARSLGQSFDSPSDGVKVSRTSGSRGRVEEYEEDDLEYSSSEDCTVESSSATHPRPSISSQKPLSETSGIGYPLDLSFGTDEQPRQSLYPAEQRPKIEWPILPESEPENTAQVNSTLSSSPDLFHFEVGVSAPRPHIHTSNPLKAAKQETSGNPNDHHRLHSDPSSIPIDELDCSTYLFHDFRPIDLSKYEPKLPFAWSSLPLICQAIAFDVENGIGRAQFSTHLLMHVQPYFFHQAFCNLSTVENAPAENLADRLMVPQLGHRVIETIIEEHMLLLKQIKLFPAAAFLRKLTVELEYLRLHRPSETEKEVGSSLTQGNSSSLSIVCTNCQGPMIQGHSLCERCKRVRSECPVCNSQKYDTKVRSDLREEAWGHTPDLWTFCHACGHSGHVSCMTEWFSYPDSDGCCPAQNCGCDCGPGVTRDLRVKQQVQSEEEAKLLRNSSNGGVSAKRDPLKATQSPAVDKARVALRGSFGERGTQSGDESRRASGRRTSSRGRIPGTSSSRKSVRLVTPGEESSRL